MSPILDASYEDRDLDYVRFRPSPTDDRIAMTVTRSTIADRDELIQMRTDMDEYDDDLLDIFTLRRIVAALRSNSMSLALEAFDAAILPGPPWRTKESDFRLPIFVALSLGVEESEIVARADRAAPVVQAAVSRDLETMSRVSDMSMVGAIEVQSSHGLGVLHLPRSAVSADNMWLAGASIIHSGSPIVHSTSDEAPSVNLAALTVDIADAVDAAGMITGPIAVSALAALWFSENPSATFVPTHGCLGFTVATESHANVFVDITVAELPMDIDAGELAQLAISNDMLDERAMATSRGSTLVLVTPAPLYSEDLVGDNALGDEDPDEDGEEHAEAEVAAPAGAISLQDLVTIAQGVLVREIDRV